MERDALRRWHSSTGLVPLGAYLCFHAWEHWPVRESHDAVYARLDRSAHAPIEIALVLLPLCVHAVLGLKLARTPDDSRAYVSPAFRQFQAITGLLAAAFLLWHVPFVWGARVLDASVPSAHDVLLEQAGSAVGSSLYVVALSAVCVHFGQGLSAVLVRRFSGVSARLARCLGVLVGVGLWLVLLDELAAYAAGAPLL